MREDAVLAAGDEDGRVLEALGVVQRHQRHQALVVGARVGVGDERDLLQELARACRPPRRRRCPSGVELAADLDELLEVLDPCPGPRSCARPRAPRGSRSAGQQRLEQLGDRRQPLVGPARRSSCIVPMKRRSALTAAAPRPGTCSGSAAASQTGSPIVSAWASTRESEVWPMPAARRVDDPREAHDVGRVDQQRQVGDRVLDLGALVELGAADHLVGDLAPHERVLDHPRHRVGAVEDGDLRARGALVDEPLDLADDEARLGVLVLELAQLDRLALAEVAPQALGDRPAVVRDHRVGRRRGSSRSSGSSARA